MGELLDQDIMVEMGEVEAEDVDMQGSVVVVVMMVEMEVALNVH